MERLVGTFQLSFQPCVRSEDAARSGNTDEHVWRVSEPPEPTLENQ
jgi:hypothetical protein